MQKNTETYVNINSDLDDDECVCNDTCTCDSVITVSDSEDDVSVNNENSAVSIQGEDNVTKHKCNDLENMANLVPDNTTYQYNSTSSESIGGNDFCGFSPFNRKKCRRSSTASSCAVESVSLPISDSIKNKFVTLGKDTTLSSRNAPKSMQHLDLAQLPAQNRMTKRISRATSATTKQRTFSLDIAPILDIDHLDKDNHKSIRNVSSNEEKKVLLSSQRESQTNKEKSALVSKSKQYCNNFTNKSESKFNNTNVEDYSNNSQLDVTDEILQESLYYANQVEDNITNGTETTFPFPDILKNLNDIEVGRVSCADESLEASDDIHNTPSNHSRESYEASESSLKDNLNFQEDKDKSHLLERSNFEFNDTCLNDGEQTFSTANCDLGVRYEVGKSVVRTYSKKSREQLNERAFITDLQKEELCNLSSEDIGYMPSMNYTSEQRKSSLLRTSAAQSDISLRCKEDKPCKAITPNNTTRDQSCVYTFTGAEDLISQFQEKYSLSKNKISHLNKEVSIRGAERRSFHLTRKKSAIEEQEKSTNLCVKKEVNEIRRMTRNSTNIKKSQCKYIPPKEENQRKYNEESCKSVSLASRLIADINNIVGGTERTSDIDRNIHINKGNCKLEKPSAQSSSNNCKVGFPSNSTLEIKNTVPSNNMKVAPKESNAIDKSMHYSKTCSTMKSCNIQDSGSNRHKQISQNNPLKVESKRNDSINSKSGPNFKRNSGGSHNKSLVTHKTTSKPLASPMNEKNKRISTDITVDGSAKISVDGKNLSIVDIIDRCTHDTNESTPQIIKQSSIEKVENSTNNSTKTEGKKFSKLGVLDNSNNSEVSPQIRSTDHHCTTINTESYLNDTSVCEEFENDNVENHQGEAISSGDKNKVTLNPIILSSERKTSDSEIVPILESCNNEPEQESTKATLARANCKELMSEKYVATPPFVKIGTKGKNNEEVGHLEADPDYDGVILYCHGAMLTSHAQQRPDGYTVSSYSYIA